MKPSERIKDIADGYFVNYPEAIMFFLDEQAELLETHTVKEPCIFDDIEGHKEKCACPTTPEKKCCFNCGIGSDGCANKKEKCCENLCYCGKDTTIGHFKGVEDCVFCEIVV